MYNDVLALALFLSMLLGDPSCGNIFWKLVISLPDPDLIQTQHQGQGLQQLTKWLKAKFHRGMTTSQHLSSVQVLKTCFNSWKRPAFSLCSFKKKRCYHSTCANLIFLEIIVGTFYSMTFKDVLIFSLVSVFIFYLQLNIICI